MIKSRFLNNQTLVVYSTTDLQCSGNMPSGNKNFASKPTHAGNRPKFYASTHVAVYIYKR
ncbi:MAG: hypothetical protein CMO80_14185 [Verrucomicrobiales bacterium]|nr:hypothetical protein [Verrucomicrobiales bacterium]